MAVHTYKAIAYAYLYIVSLFQKILFRKTVVWIGLWSFKDGKYLHYIFSIYSGVWFVFLYITGI